MLISPKSEYSAFNTSHSTVYVKTDSNVGSPVRDSLCFSYLAAIRMQQADIDQAAVAKLCHKSGEQLDST